MPFDPLTIAMRNEEFLEDVMANPEISNSALAVIDRIILFFGNEIDQAKITGPNTAAGEFDVCWNLGVKNG